MTTYIMRGKYSPEAAGLISSQRTTRATEIIRACGGSIAAAYATMGEADLLAIVEFPGDREATKASVALSSSMGIHFVTVPAIRIEEFDDLVGEVAQ